MVDNGSKLDETEFRIVNINEVVELPEPCYKPEFSWDDSLVNFSDPIRDVELESRAVFDCWSNIDDVDSGTDVGSVDGNVQPIWDDDVPDANSLETNVEYCVGELFNIVTGFTPLICENELIKTAKHSIGPKEKVGDVHTLLVVKTGNETFIADFIRAVNVLVIDRNVLKNVAFNYTVGAEKLFAGLSHICDTQPCGCVATSLQKVGKFVNLLFEPCKSVSRPGKFRTAPKALSNKPMGWIDTPLGFMSNVDSCGSERFNTNGSLYIGVWFNYFADFSSLIKGYVLPGSFVIALESENLKDGVHTLEASKNSRSLGLMSVLSEFCISYTDSLVDRFISGLNMDFVDDVPRSWLLFMIHFCGIYVWGLFQSVIHFRMAWQRVENVLLILVIDMDFQEFVAEVYRLAVWELLRRVTSSRTELRLVSCARFVLSVCVLDFDLQELWSIPSKGGGDDTNTFTASFTNGPHLRTLHLRGRKESYMEMFSYYTRVLVCYEYYEEPVSRVIWMLAQHNFVNSCYSFGCYLLSVDLFICSSLASVYSRIWKIACWVSVVRWKYLISCFTAYLVSGLHNMHWMDRNEVRMRFSEVFSVLSLCVKSATHLEQLRDAHG